MTYAEFKQYEEVDDYFNNLVPADSFSVYYPQSKISKNKTIKREHGNNIVFHYYFKSSNHIEIADDGFDEYIEFEIPYSNNKKTYFTNNPAEFNTTFQWYCFCDYPDSIEAKKNEGTIDLTQISDSTWRVKLHLKNKLFGNQKILDRVFTLYKPQFELDGSDTLNKYDSYRRKQGHWITEDKFWSKNGIYQDNYFTGVETYFQYHADKKTIRYIATYQNDSLTQWITFDKFGKMIKK